MNTAQIIKEFRGYQKENPSAIQSLIKADNVARQYYEGISEATEGFTDFDEEIIEASEFNKVMERFNAKLKATLTDTPNKGSEPKFKKGDRVKNIKDGKKGEVYDVFERSSGSITYSVNWDGERVGQAGIKEEALKKLAMSQEKAKKIANEGKSVRKAKSNRKAKAKPRVRTVSNEEEKPQKTAAKPRKVTSAKTKKVEQEAVIVRTHIETPEHKQISRFLAIRSKETLQLAMTAYKSLQKDITERKIRKTSEQAALIQVIQKSYYAYLTRETTSLVLDEKWLKEAKEFVGSQKPFESVALVKRFIGWGGKTVKEKQLSEFAKDAEKALKSGKESDPYADELKAILLKVKKAKAGDSLLADAVGLSGLTRNTIKVQK